MTPKFLTVSEKGTDALPISKESGIERAVDILLGEIIMTSVLSSLSFSLLSVIQSFMSSIQPHRVNGVRKAIRSTEFLFINLESQLRLAAEVTGNSLSALLDSHPYHVHTHICLCLRTLGVYIMIVNLTFSHCFNVF